MLLIWIKKYKNEQTKKQKPEQPVKKRKPTSTSCGVLMQVKTMPGGVKLPKLWLFIYGWVYSMKTIKEVVLLSSFHLRGHLIPFSQGINFLEKEHDVSSFASWSPFCLTVFRTRFSVCQNRYLFPVIWSSRVECKAVAVSPVPCLFPIIQKITEE